MLLLGLDTSTLTLSLALVERSPEGADRLLGARREPPPALQGHLLPGLVGELLEEAGVRLSDLGGVVIGLGPGSFIGLRIGLAMAKGLCYAAQLPLVGASSLAAMAREAYLQHGEERESRLYVPCLDARKGELYCGAYRFQAGEALQRDELLLTPGALIEHLAKEGEYALFGEGRGRYPELEQLPISRCGVATPDALHLLATARVIPPYSKEALSSMEPRYLRPDDAEWKTTPKRKNI